jgi:hypothetical protein
MIQNEMEFRNLFFVKIIKLNMYSYLIYYHIGIRDAGRKLQSSESRLTADVFILQEPKTAENREHSWENDEAQAQKLNQGRIVIKFGFFR